jgi:N-hydroxyarylamine O-acetyltransferase
MKLEAYFARVSYKGRATVDYPTLCRVHRAHVTAIPFENLDIQMGRPVELAVARLEDKMVRRHRGGYCFEHNTLLASALEAIGFSVTACEARVTTGGSPVTPRTHMLLVVSLDGRRWLCDAGFGGDTPLEPVALDGSVSLQEGDRYRVAVQGAQLVLQADLGEGWTDQYSFEDVPRPAIDFEVANWYTSTHPDSRFVRTLTAQQRTATGSRILRNLQWSERRGTRQETRTIERPQLEQCLVSGFGLALPAGARFRALDGDF